MALKYKYATQAEVPEPLRPYYEAGQDGAFYLQAEGVVPKVQLDEFRNNNITLKQQVETLEAKYKDIDPVKYQEYKAAAEKTPAAIEDAVKARLGQLQQEHATILQAKDQELVKTKTTLDAVLIDGSLKSEAAKLGVLPTALDDVVFRGRTVFKNENGAVIAYNDKGEKLYDKDGVSPLTVGGWIKGLKTSAPHLFAGMNGGGGNGNGGAGGGNLPANATAVQKIQAGLANIPNGA